MQKKKAAVFILLGQSNAVGHGVPMEEKDVIQTPLKNVFGLSRNNNQSFDSTQLVWSGYTSCGMNLAEEQDNTYSVANCLASLWQNRIDSGEDLPDLHIIQIAIGAQGVTKEYMWYPEKEKTLIPGPLGTVDISLFSFCSHIFSMLDESFSKQNKEYEIIGLHWRGGENDVTEELAYLQSDLRNVYCRIFGTFNNLLNNPPIILHELHCPDRMHDMDPTGAYLEKMEYINSVFGELANDFANISLFDVRNAPQYVPDVRGNGIFIEDAVHFTPQVNNWVAERIVEEYIG